MTDQNSIKFELAGEYIELFKILKLLGLAHSGGFAKQFIADELVQVNGEIETRKRRKIIVGDTIVFDSQEIRVTTV